MSYNWWPIIALITGIGYFCYVYLMFRILFNLSGGAWWGLILWILSFTLPFVILLGFVV